MRSAFPLDALVVPHTVARNSQTFLTSAVVASATPHTKGAWSQIYTTTLEDTYMMRVFVDATFVSTVNTATLLDIGVGALGSEIAVVQNLLIGNWRPSAVSGSSSSNVPGYYDVPIFIPAGTRIAARIQSAVVSESVAVAIDLFGRSSALGEPFTGRGIDPIGPDTATSHGALLTCGASGVTGAWTQLVAATARTYRAFLIGVDGGGSAAMANQNVTLDIGVGGSGSEVLLLPQDFIHAQTTSAETCDLREPSSRLITLSNPLPSGTRVSMRGTQSAGTAQTLGVALYGVR